MAEIEFATEIGSNRQTATLESGDTATLSLSRGSNVTMELTGGGTISHQIIDTGVEIRSIVANEAYNNAARENFFSYAGGTSVLITVDEKV